MVVKLSEATPESLKALDKLALETGKLIEMRNRFGLLLSVGTTISAFQDCRDKKGNYLFSVEKKFVYPSETEIVEKTVHDVYLGLYSPRYTKTDNPTFQKVLNNSEKYWEDLYKRWESSDSVLKECPAIIINRLKKTS